MDHFTPLPANLQPTGASSDIPVTFEQQEEQNRQKKKVLSFVKHVSAISAGTVLGIPLVLFMFFQLQGQFTRANDPVPRDVVVSETTETSAIVQWTSDQESQGVILYGTEQTTLNKLAPETSPGVDHTVIIENLEPGTTYYFSIQVEGLPYTNGGIPWFFTTKTPGGQAPSPIAPSSCPVLDTCSEIQELLGKGCSTADYIQCLQRNRTGSPE